MRVLLLTQYFHPEYFKSNDIAFELVKRGYEVEALVGIPNYPEGVYPKSYGLFRKRVETVNGVKVYRCFQTPRGRKASPIGLAINYLSFVISATMWVLFYFAWKKKYDVILTHEPSPITQIVPAIILGKIRKTPVYSWILDIWPDSFISKAGGMAKFLKPSVSAITEYVYRGSKFVMVSSKGMMPLVNRKHDYTEKLVYFPNWCDDILSLPVKESVKLPDGFKVMMAGSINRGIGPDAVIKLTEELRNEDNLWLVFVGGGTKEQEMRDAFKEKGITNVVMTGRLPFEQMPALYAQADAMLMTLLKTDKPHLKATVPARLQSYMAAGKPILAMVDGCSQDVIKAADCGYCVDAEDYQAMADKIRKMKSLAEDELNRLGKNSRQFYERHYQMKGCMNNLEHYLNHPDCVQNPPYPVPEV